MKNALRILLPLATLLLLSCRALSLPLGLASPTPTSSPAPAALNLRHNPSPTPAPTATPIPSPTLAPSPTLPPSPTPQPSPTIAPTPLPLSVQLSVFTDLWTVIESDYLYPEFNGLDWDAIYAEYEARIQAGLSNEDFYLAMDEMVFRLGDDHSVFLDPARVAEDDAEYAGNLDYVGIGVLIAAVPERDRAVLILIFPGSPAEEAGLQSRDSVLAVDGEPILDEDGYLRDIVRGPEGTTIRVTVQTPGEPPRDVDITRRRINSGYPVPYQVLTSPQGQRIGFILLPTFGDLTINERFAEALEGLTAQGRLDGLIIDNRQNGGGADTVLRPTLSRFVSGQVGTFFSRFEERPLTIRPDEINGSATVPLVVLIGPDTVSYGEVFAGVLQDQGRAYLIGEATYGNVETLWGYDFEDGSRAWIAHESFRPAIHPDWDWELTGVIPDLEVPVAWDEYTVLTDPAILAALDYFDTNQPGKK